MLGILKNRFAILSLLWALLFIMIVSRLIDLQLVNTDRYVKESNTKNLSQRELMAPRGNIYDRNGIPIAVSAEYYDLIFYRTDATNAEINRMCLSILGILDRNGDGFSSAFKNYFSFDPIEYGPSLKSKVSIASTHTDINGISGADDILAIIESNSRFYVNPTGTVVPIRPGDMVAELDMRGNDSYLDRMKAYADWLRASESTLSRIERLFYVEPGTLKYMKSAEEVYAYIAEVLYRIDGSYTDEERYRIMSMRFTLRDAGYSVPVTLARGVSKVTVIELEERHADFPGVYSMINYRREYLSPIPVCHILGYIGAMNANEYDLYRNLGYGVSDLIGKSGVEKTAEKDLHGRSGRMVVETDPMGRIQRVVRVDRPEPGDNIILTIDLGLQTVASESLAKTINDISSKAEGKTSPQNKGDANSGAVVVMDINSGEVLALASYPFYDPSLFLEPSTNAEAQRSITELFTDALSPSLNRAISGQYPPGSTFKPLIAIAALEEGIIAPNQYIEDPGMIYVDRTPLLCLETRHGALPHGHGFIELSTALATSCNIYFHKLGLELTGDGIDKWGRIFGLGERTGIDLDSESKGIRASPEYKRTKKDAGSWGQLDTALAAIGQHDNSFTPIQLCNYMAVIASNGRKYTPHVILRRESFDGMKVYNTLANYEQLSVSQSIFEEVKEGMLKVANSQEGTAATVFAEFTEKYGIVVAGKTGTAETSESMSTAEDHSNNGVFICYAPAENPQIAVAVVIQRGVFGYYAADVAKDIMEYYFGEMTTIHPGDKGSEASRPLGYAYLIE